MEYLFDGLLLLAGFAVSTLIAAACLWFGMLAAGWYAGLAPGARYCSFRQLWMTAVVAGPLSLIPWIGWLAALVATFVLLRKFSEADFRELVVLVVVSRFAAAIMWLIFTIAYANVQSAMAS